MLVGQKLRKLLNASAALLFVGSVILSVPMHAMAATPTSPQPAPKISLTFDDGLASADTQAAPTLATYGLSGTDYVITGCVGMTTAPNNCRANTDASYMSWDQITQLQSQYGWEIGSHTVNHYCLASTGDGTDCQTNLLTPDQVTTELSQSKADLAAHGINAIDMSTPYGDYNNAVLAQIAKYYQSQRGFADTGYNSWPNSDYYLKVQQVTGGVSVSTVQGYINNAIANNQWLVLVFHDIKTKASRKPDDYEYSTSNLAQIAAYVQSKQQAGQIQNVTVNQGLVNGSPNLLANGSFNDGISDGWTTDNSAAFVADSGSNGSYPDVTNSIKFKSAGTTSHLFSPLVAVNSNNTYLLKSFLNVQTLASGSVGYYIDEYDANGNWISGQYKASEPSSFVEEMNFSYKPSSVNVAKASLQIIVTGNSGISGYLDNAQWIALTNNPAPTYTNLMPNSTFDAGLSSGWSTDSPTLIKADSSGNGSPADPINSIKMQSTTKNIHLFSPKIAVDSTKLYSISSYLNLKQITSGVIGFYIDEYDSSGNWISGQYKTDRSTVSQSTVGFSYVPSSTSVKQASLQVIVVANSNSLAYIDDVQWLVPNP